MTIELHEAYTRSCEIYDLIYQELFDYPAQAERVVSIIGEGVPHAATLLEVGCGSGLYLEHFGHHYEVEGLDLSEAMLARARVRCPQVELHPGDMIDFDLGRSFDAVVCLASSIGYVGTVDGLRQSIAAMARHVSPGGVLIVEPWFRPDVWDTNHIGADLIEKEGIKVARFSTSMVDQGCSVMDMTHLVATPGRVEAFSERHVMGLFTIDDHLDAFRRAGLDVEYDPDGLTGRGLYVGARTRQN